MNRLISPAEEDQQSVNAPRSDRYIKIAEVMHITSYSKSGVYSLMRRGIFPKSIKKSTRRTVWRESEVQAWVRGEFKPATVASVISIFGGEIQS